MIRIDLEVGNDFENRTERLFYLINDASINSVANIIQKDIEVNIAYGRSIFGGNVKPNLKGSRVLFDSGELFRSIKNDKNNDSSEKGRVIYVGEDRRQIANWLQFGTTKMDARPFFGISQIVMDKINAYYDRLMSNAEKSYLK